MKKHIGLTDPEPMIGIEQQDRQQSIELLNKILSNEFVLLTQTLNYHWNLIGAQFSDYHKLFDTQYRDLFDFLDGIAERIRTIGGIAIASMSEMIAKSDLTEDVNDIPEPATMVKNLLKQHEILIRIIRDGIKATTNDAGTNNFLTDLIEKHEKMAWMLRSLSAR